MGSERHSELPEEKQDAALSQSPQQNGRKRIWVLLAVLFFVSVPYLQMTQAYFLGYDDFFFVHRSFEDAKNPSKIFSESHSPGDAKYRPLDRGLDYVTYRLGHGSPFFYRARNLSFHLLNCALVFGLALLLFDSTLTAALAALLFGLNPMVHQVIAGDVWTNTTAASMVLIALILGLRSYYAKKHEFLWLVLAVFAAWIGIFFYEPDAAVLGMIFLYLALDSLRLRRLSKPKSWTGKLALLSAAAVGSVIVIRGLVLHGAHLPAAPPVVIAKSAAMYAIAMVFPVDPLLANQWFGTPLVSDIRLSAALMALAVGVSVCVLGFLLYAFRRSLRASMASEWFMQCLFLLGATVFSNLLQLVFADHPSETYLYLPEAFFMLFVARMLMALRGVSPKVFGIVTILLLVSFASATWGRSRRVIHSAAISQRILSELPTSDWKQGDWHIRLASTPGYALSHGYGLYTYRGLATIATEDHVSSIEYALEVRTGNELVTADVIPAEQMSQVCGVNPPAREPCFWVYPDGRVEKLDSR
jgi:hypothetical protein